ncbi:PIN domain-containing protein [Pantoea sp. JK]|uniref:PIN domain-containing protein n=1 Tax=Pantoea sp. JK TaxID=2871703 RepID=UPI00223717E1|nr:PIN domain-containing protein [Pantoea sp. JK]MCW6031602.1 PIN domain-containing protein [Pantoea sp. JK]
MGDNTLHLVLDSNVLHEEGLNSNDMKLLKKYTDKKLIKLHIPKLVAREFLTRKSSSLFEGLDKSRQSLDSVERDARGLSEDLLGSLEELKQKIIQTKEKIGDKPQQSFEQWIKDFNVSIVDTTVESVNEVFDDYFSGSGVFRKIKAREDIPDGFICATIINLTKEHGSLVVVNKDNVFKKHLARYEQVTVLNSMNEVFSLEGVGLLQDESKVELIQSDEFSHAIKEYLDANPRAFDYLFLEDELITNMSVIGQRIYAASIELELFNDASNIKVMGAKGLDEQTFIASLCFDMDVHVNYITDYGSFLDIERLHGRTPEMDSMNGEGICDVSENTLARFYGDLTIKFANPGNEIKKDELIGLLFRGEISINFEDKNAEIIKML